MARRGSRVLIDSHVLLWVLTDDGRLGQAARRALGQADAVHVSAITFLELRIKQQLGRLRLPDDLADRVSGQGFQLAPFTAHDADALARFPELVRHDPFDRALLAQASVQGWQFLTAEEKLLGLGHPGVLDARR